MVRARSSRVSSGCTSIGSGPSFRIEISALSAPVYRTVQERLAGTLREEYDCNIARSGLTGFVTTHVGRAEEVAATWTLPIDLLFMDGDHSREGVQAAFKAWMPFLKVGGLLALHSTTSTEEHHDGILRPRQSSSRRTTVGREAACADDDFRT